MTPMTVRGTPLTTSFCPRMLRSAPSSPFQYEWARTTTLFLPGWSSSGAKPRPRNGACPSTVNRSADAIVTSTLRASPPRVRLAWLEVYVATPPSVRVCSLTDPTFGHDHDVPKSLVLPRLSP